MLRSVTDAFATAALFGSVAVPPTAPVTADWASARLPTQATVKAKRIARDAKRKELILNIMSASLVKNREYSSPQKIPVARGACRARLASRVSLADLVIPA